MKKAAKNYGYLNHGHFPGVTLFSVGMTPDELVKKLVKDKAEDWAETVRSASYDNSWGQASKTVWKNNKTGKEKTYFIITVREFKFSDFDYIALAHEILHICQLFLKGVNVNRDVETESEAYFHSHLMEQALNIIRGK